jgi:hypothetical protein
VLSDKQINHVRGVIIHITDEGVCKIVAESFPFSEDIPVDNILNEDLNFDETYTVTEVYEGTVIRIYKGPITGKWHFSTHKKINGRNSRWSGPTFGEMFDSMWNIEYNFDTYFKNDRCYVFILSHPENKLVCNITPSLRLIAAYDRFDNKLTLSNNTHLEKTHPNVIIHNDVFSNLASKEELKEIVSMIPVSRSTGVFVYKLSHDNSKFLDYYKLSNSVYLEKRLLRGNEPNLKLRYLEFKLEKNEYLGDFLSLFSEKKELFDEVDKDFGRVALYLKKFYNRRYKNGEYCVFPQEEHIIVENTKKNYNKTLSVQENIEKTLSTGTARQINTLIKHMKYEDKEI